MYSFEHEEKTGIFLSTDRQNFLSKGILYDFGRGFFMRLGFEEICEKEVVNIIDGTSFGSAGDIIFDAESRKICSLVIKGKPRFFGILGREEDIFIPWEEIETIGKDVILVKTLKKRKIISEKQNIFQKILNFFL